MTKNHIIRPYIEHVDLEAIAKSIPYPNETPAGNPGENPPTPRGGASTEPRSGFVYVPGLNLSFSKERMHMNEDWYKTHKLLQDEKLRMPTMKEFNGFLKYLLDSREEELQNLYKEITEVRNPWRSNWIDAFFEQKADGLYLNSRHVYSGEDSEGRICVDAQDKKKLEPCLMTDRGKLINETQGINLEEWLHNPTSQGLPREDISEGELYFWYPRNGSVAGFVADSDWAWPARKVSTV